MSTNRFRLLAFDWDGTLMDSTARIVSAFRGAMRDTGLPVLAEDTIRDIIGLGLPEAIASLYPGIDLSDAQALASRYSQHYLHDDPTPVRLFAGALELLEQLREGGYWLSIATGKSRRGLDQVLADTGLAGHFLATRCADETASKPHPDMLISLMDEFGCTPEETLMIGDSEFDLLMARNARVPSVGVAHGVHGCERLARHAPLACLRQLNELTAVLDRASANATHNLALQGTSA
ncbi:MAG: HAD-IA family hydrolase [Pseudomonadota bacterium]